ncbi:MAG: hypothetical protein ACREJB_10965, partial [Planctomycetaceae bacterium]
TDVSVRQHVLHSALPIRNERVGFVNAARPVFNSQELVFQRVRRNRPSRARRSDNGPPFAFSVVCEAV